MKLRLDPQLWNTLEGYRISWKVMRTLSALTQWKLLEEDSHVFKDEKGTTLSQNGSSFLQLGMLVVVAASRNEGSCYFADCVTNNTELILYMHTIRHTGDKAHSPDNQRIL
ncbi:hypothetical protein CGCFRS4_v015991 [Colletotrichum fructicola]|nr:hypothetical protein CGCFRS4_v015991 [Colletotrichum fructicola]